MGAGLKLGRYGIPPSQSLSHDIPSTKGERNALGTYRFVFSCKFKLIVVTICLNIV